MPKFTKLVVFATSVAFLFTACSGSNKQPETAADSSKTVHTTSAPKATGLAKWQINAPNQFSGAKWASFKDNYPPCDLEIAPDEDFKDRINTLLNGENYNLDEYICSNSEFKKASDGREVRIVTCTIQAFQEYSYFISVIDPKTKVNHIYIIKDISVNKYLGKARESDPERIFSYDIDEVENLPFMDTTALLVRIDRSFKLGYSQGTDTEVSTIYHTFENYIIAGDEQILVTHWSSKHSQDMTDWMSCDKSNPDPAVCPSVQTEEICKSADFDGNEWKINSSECL